MGRLCHLVHSPRRVTGVGSEHFPAYKLKINLISCIFIGRHGAHYLDGYVHLFLIWTFWLNWSTIACSLPHACISFFIITTIIICGVNLRINWISWSAYIDTFKYKVRWMSYLCRLFAVRETSHTWEKKSGSAKRTCHRLPYHKIGLGAFNGAQSPAAAAGMCTNRQQTPLGQQILILSDSICQSYP